LRSGNVLDVSTSKSSDYVGLLCRGYYGKCMVPYLAVLTHRAIVGRRDKKLNTESKVAYVKSELRYSTPR